MVVVGASVRAGVVVTMRRHDEVEGWTKHRGVGCCRSLHCRRPWRRDGRITLRPNVGGGVCMREDSLKERNAFFFWKERVIGQTSTLLPRVQLVTYNSMLGNMLDPSG